MNVEPTTRHYPHPAPDSESTAMPVPDHSDQDATRDHGARVPSIAEIAALTSRLRHLRSADATDAERATFIADKNALLARLPGVEQLHAVAIPSEMVDGIEERRTAPASRDDPAELQTRLDDLRAQVAVAHTTAEDDADQARTEQLCHWHTDDQADDQAEDGAQDDAGWSR